MALSNFILLKFLISHFRRKENKMMTERSYARNADRILYNHRRTGIYKEKGFDNEPKRC